MQQPVRRLAAAAVTLALVALVACDLLVGGIQHFWDRHSLTASVVASLLVLAVTALVVDEVVARRQRQDRAVSVAVQSLIVFGQTRRAYDEITPPPTHEGTARGVTEELRTLAGMLLTAAPNLFDDPVARHFLEEVERFSVSMFRAASILETGDLDDARRRRLASEMADLRTLMEPLLARIPVPDRSLLEGSPEE